MARSDWVPQLRYNAFDAFPWGGLATGRCGGHASKQAGKALLTGAIEQSVLGSFQLRNKTKVCTKTHQSMYTGGLSHGLG